MTRVLNEYSGVNEKDLEGYTITKVQSGVFADETGMIIELEREIDNVILGIDIVYDPEHTENEMDLAISNEYMKRVM